MHITMNTTCRTARTVFKSNSKSSTQCCFIVGFFVLAVLPFSDAFSTSLASGFCAPRKVLRSATTGVRGLRADVSVTLATPLGIVFEEVEPGEPKGLVVADLVPGGNAEKDGKIWVGDKLIATSAVVLDNSNQPIISLGASSATNNWKREMIPCGNMDFNTIMSAIKSNRFLGRADTLPAQTG